MKPGSAWLSDREVRAVVGALRRLSHSCEILAGGNLDHLDEAIRLDDLATRVERRAGSSARKHFDVGLAEPYRQMPAPSSEPSHTSPRRSPR